MQPLTIGAFSVQSVHEATGAYITPADLFPDAAPEAVAAHFDCMAPTFFDTGSGKLKLVFQSFVLQTPNHNILTDTCVGEDKERANPNSHMKKWPWMDNLKALGLTPADIDIVMSTHLHPDHVGWNTQRRDRRWVPAFPNAKYVFARDVYAHWETDSNAGTEQTGLTFIDSMLPVAAAGQAVLVEHDHQIEHGIWIEPTPGHSPGHVIVNVKSNGKRSAFVGDLMHHPIQFPHPEWSTCLYWDMAMSAASRTAFLGARTDSDTLVLPVHFAGATAGHIVRSGDSQTFKFLDDNN